MKPSELEIIARYLHEFRTVWAGFAIIESTKVLDENEEVYQKAASNINRLMELSDNLFDALDDNEKDILFDAAKELQKRLKG